MTEEDREIAIYYNVGAVLGIFVYLWFLTLF